MVPSLFSLVQPIYLQLAMVPSLFSLVQSIYLQLAMVPAYSVWCSQYICSLLWCQPIQSGAAYMYVRVYQCTVHCTLMVPAYSVWCSQYICSWLWCPAYSVWCSLYGSLPQCECVCVGAASDFYDKWNDNPEPYFILLGVS